MSLSSIWNVCIHDIDCAALCVCDTVDRTFFIGATEKDRTQAADRKKGRSRLRSKDSPKNVDGGPLERNV